VRLRHKHRSERWPRARKRTAAFLALTVVFPPI
jgi:hypothetical protein